MKIGPKSAKTKKDAIGKLRKTQLITTFAPGAIADMPDYSVIMAATDYWSHYSPVIHEPNLERLLGIDGFKEPYATDSENPKGNPDVPAFRFPRIHFCPKCGDLKDYKLFGDSKHKKCQCGRQLVPSRFVCSCINGHLEDFPYKWWVHYGNYSECPEADKWDQLKIEFKNTTGGLSSIVITCKACGKSRTMEGCMSKDALKGYKCKGKRPWIGFDKDFDDTENCIAPMRTLQRGASNVFFSVTESALTIPPYSQKIQSDLSDKWEEVKGLFDNKMDDDNIKIVLGASIFRQVVAEGRYTAEDYFKAAKERYNLQNHAEAESVDEPYTEQMLYEDEFDALCAGYEQDEEDTEPEQFIAVETDLPDILEGFVDSVILVKRLREVLAVKGFRRITPEKPRPDDDRAVGMNGRNYQPVWNKPHDWLPAIQMRGEGLFLKFDEDKLVKWEQKNSARYELMKERLADLNIGKGMMSPRYVVLHTFAHLLIRQLTLECGYSGAALKERIYSTFPGADKSMAGVLIYTSSSDSDGSLGGLVRQGDPELLETTIRNMLQEASWCSSDPLCSDSTAQGYNSLNYAACHACTLLPETSCVARNCLLDRVSIVGTYDDRSLGYFGELLEDE